MNWQLPPEDVGRGLRELVKRGEAEYSPLIDAGVEVPAWRKVGIK